MYTSNKVQSIAAMLQKWTCKWPWTTLVSQKLLRQSYSYEQIEIEVWQELSILKWDSNIVLCLYMKYTLAME